MLKSVQVNPTNHKHSASQQVAAQTIFCDCNLNFRSFPQATQNVCNFMRNNQGFQATFSLSNVSAPSFHQPTIDN